MWWPDLVGVSLREPHTCQTASPEIDLCMQRRRKQKHGGEADFEDLLIFIYDVTTYAIIDY